MPESAENYFQSYQEYEQCSRQKCNFQIGRLPVFLEKRKYIVVYEGRNNIELKNECECKNQQQADHIKCPFRYNSANQLLGRNFFVTGQYSTLDYLTQPGSAKIYKIAYHYGKEGIQPGGKITHGLHQLSPAKSPKPVTYE